MMHLERVLMFTVPTGVILAGIFFAMGIRSTHKNNLRRGEILGRIGFVCALMGVCAIAGLYFVAMRKMAIEAEIRAIERKQR
jgi:hypothetical protein